MDAKGSNEYTRRRELANFLRSRRERLTPDDVGLPQGMRRRTPGLRREEVALLAGVGSTWYTWLEQGRDVRPSAEVLSAIARALLLDPDEQQHLYRLSDRPPHRMQATARETVPSALLRALESMAGQPAYVLGRRWDILAWNRAAAAVFGDYGLLEGDARNIMHMVFANPEHRRKVVDWEIMAPIALANFRADSVRFAGDPDFERLIVFLRAASPEFEALWSRHEVSNAVAGFKRIDQPEVGLMVFEYTRLAVLDNSDLKLVIYTPMQEEGSAEKLARLLGDFHK
ncbi:helix-turn-helix transcriptional regulator [Brenneria tiliae]|uniref:helix-turn-helix transcriptional regulator n=1 Tax=Brenneria tiliae TaxID=2914984 RepID=UPI002014A312|nr:helix-turn-helix transcriptional regulator [Brenneria tiliae]MCL2900327.1 helix-turn-helix transcriptional regulator [Brenneria tiliae]MCL2904186.1 helix-turn-helix transcriptional regulator [Brenneria tiliae]